MNLKRVRSLMLCVLPVSLPLFSACGAPADPSAESADDGEGSVGAAAQAVVTSGSVIQIASGGVSTLAVMSNGTISSWGDNTDLELGYTTTGPQTTPAQISGLSGFKAVSAGATNYSLALRSDGTLWAWGSNMWGQLGIGQSSFGDQGTPTLISGLSGVTAISAGASPALAVRSDGTVWAWGFNGHGEVGTGTTGGSFDAPQQVQTRVGGALVPLTGITSVTGATSNALALRSDGTVWGWGWNNHGQVGNGNDNPQNAAVQVMVGSVPLTGITAVSTGVDGASSYALASDGTIWAWGNNGNGQLGNGTSGADQYTPAQVSVGGAPLSGITAVVGTYDSALALSLNGTVWAWGNNGACALGRTGGAASTPAQISGLSGVTAIAAGYQNAFARTSDGKIWAWGDNSAGQLGDGTTTTACAPEVVLSP
jgi:alpha-tubulin suppressor-like RCC1 family protein